MNGTDRNPYVGPYAFQEKDAGFFYGREREAQLLPSLVISESLTLFFAQSGAGKTSLLNAKLVPELKQEGFEVLRVARVGGELPDGIVPANVYTFNAVWSLAGSEHDPKSLRDLSLDEYLRLDALDQTSPRRVLIFDQFEEILTTHPERWRQREDFFLQLREALLDDSALSVVLVLREDHVAGLDRYAPLLPGQFRTRFRMERLRYDDAIDAVRRPAKEAGRPFATGVAEHLVENLSQLHLAGQAKTLSGEFVEPVQLQVVCYQLWENLRGKPGPEITQEDLNQFGNIDEALETFYETAVEGAAKATGVSEERIRKWCGTRLITSSRIRSQVSQEGEAPGGLPKAAVDQLVKSHLVRPEEARGGTWYELAHDRFIDPVLLSNELWSKQREKPLSADARAWQEAQRDPLRLYSGSRLRAAKDQVKADPEAFGELEKDFLTRSQEEEAEVSKKWTRWLAAALCIMVVLAIFAFWQRRVAMRESRLSASRELALVAQGKSSANPDLGLLLALEALKESRTPEAEAALHQALNVSVVHKSWKMELRSANDVAISPDGTRLAAVGDDGELGVWKSDSQETVFHLTEKSDSAEPLSLVSVAFAPSGKYLATGDALGRVRIRNAESGHVLSTLPVEALVNGLAFSPDGRLLAVASERPAVIVWDLENPAAGKTLHLEEQGHENSVSDVAFSPDQRLLASVGEDGQSLLWDVRSGRRVGDLPRQSTAVTCVAFSKDGKLATAGEDLVARIWSLQAREPVHELLGHRDWIWDLSFSPDGNYLATGSQDGSAKIWDLGSDLAIHTLLPESGPVVSVAFGSRPGQIAMASQAVSGTEIVGAATLWTVLLDNDVKTLGSDGARLNRIAFSPDGKFLATAMQEGRVVLWTTSGDRLDLIGSKGGPPIQDVAFSPKRELLAAARLDGAVLLWDLHTRPSSPRQFQADEKLSHLAFSTDGRLLATLGESGTVRIWEITDLGRQSLFAMLPGRQNDFAFSSDGKSLAAAGSDRKVRLWSLYSKSWRPPSMEQPSAVLRIVFSPDGRHLATADIDRSVRLWDVEQGRSLLDPLQGHAFRLTGIAFSPDGSRLATSSSDGIIKIWDSELGLELFTLPGNSSGVSDLAFSPDGKLLATAGRAGKIRLEPLAIDDLVRIARQRLQGRELTKADRQRYLRK